MTETPVSIHTGSSTSVVEAGLCTGCGVCASDESWPDEIVLDHGRLQARAKREPSDEETNRFRRICPSSEASIDEDRISEALFPDSLYNDGKIGRYNSCHAGSVKASDYRASGSSGGMATWLATELLKREMVDAVVHVHETPVDENNQLHFRFHVSRTIDEVRAGAKSRYYPVEMSNIFQEIRDIPGRYAVVGIPCFVKSIRLLAMEDEIISQRISYCIGIVCGHLKSQHFSELIAIEGGVEPEQVSRIDFRHKIQGKPANQYAARMELDDGREVVVPMKGLMAADWGAGLFRYPACDYCDDVVAETADVTFGDAWLPEFAQDSRGTNLAIVRNPQIGAILEDGAKSGELALQPLTAQKVAKAQAGGFRHRRDGLSYRLQKRCEREGWAPKKRVSPTSSHLTERQKRVFELRERFTNEGPATFIASREKRDHSHFEFWFQDLNRQYRKASLKPVWVRSRKKIQRGFLKLVALTGTSRKIRQASQDHV